MKESQIQQDKRKQSVPKKTTKPTKHNFRIGDKYFKVPITTLQDIRKLQQTTKLCIPKLPFSKLVREVLMENTSIDMKVERKALAAIQEAAEIYITHLFEDSNACAQHAHRITLKPNDIRLALLIRGVNDPGNLLR